MKNNIADKIFQSALAYCEKNYPEDLAWARETGPHTFKNMRCNKFLKQYCWVVYASGFNANTLGEKFPALSESFKNFELDRVVKMRKVSGLSGINNETKARCFLDGCRMIAEEGFSAFKKRLGAQGMNMLEELPGIGEITKRHLAKNIGLIDIAKDDIWLCRVAEKCDASVDELVGYLSAKHGESQHVVDVVIWAHAKDK